MNYKIFAIAPSTLALSFVVSTGCAGTIATSGSVAFSPSYPDNEPAAVERAAGEVASSRDETPIDVAIAVDAARTNVIGFDPTTGAVAFRAAIATNLPVVVTGRYALVESERTVRLLDLRTGRPAGSIELGGADGFHMIGASASGNRVAVSLSRGTGTNAHSRLVLLHDGSIDEEVTVDRPMGVPAIVGNRVAVPWAYQNLSFLDFDGSEHARIRLRTSVIGHAIARNGRLWFGAASLYRFGNGSAIEEASGYTPPDLGIERPPSLLRNAYEHPAPLTSAAYHVRYAFAPEPSGDSLAPADGQLYLVHYRFLFALDAASGLTRWIRVLPGDVVGIKAFPGGVRAAAETGEVLTLAAADGRLLAQASIGERVSHVGFATIDAAPTTSPLETERPDVRSQLFEAVETPDARLVTAREFALARLAALEDADATADLGVLCEDERLPERTRRRACELLSGRSTGEEHIEAQLRRHGSFLDERPHPPVGTLARAAATMRYTSSAPLLVQQLEDPRTSARAVEAIANALVVLGDASIAPALESFLRTYHADVEGEGMLEAVGATAKAYAELGGDRAMAEIESLASDPLCPDASRRAMRDAVAAVRASRAPQVEPQPETPTTTPEPPRPARPLHISLESATQVLAPVDSELRGCLNRDPAHPGSVRLILVITRAGEVSGVHATPVSVTECLAEHIRPLRFPETQGAGPTTRLTLTIRAR